MRPLYDVRSGAHGYSQEEDESWPDFFDVVFFGVDFFDEDDDLGEDDDLEEGDDLREDDELLEDDDDLEDDDLSFFFLSFLSSIISCNSTALFCFSFSMFCFSFFVVFPSSCFCFFTFFIHQKTHGQYFLL